MAATVDAVRPQAEAGGVKVGAELHPGLQAARADPQQLQRVLFNLIENAIHHTPPGGTVVVRAEPGRRHVRFEVADTGEGIAEVERERVFEAFFRGGAHTARADAGAGLGLAIARAIVERHGGRIWLAGRGPGTCVRFSLPSASRGCRGIAGAPGGSARVRLPGGSGRRPRGA